MKNPRLLLVATLALFVLSGCNKHSAEAAEKIAKLEQQNKAAVDRQRELEQQLDDQKLAAERDAIERDRAQIEEDRASLEQQQGEVAAENDQAIRAREEALAKREGKLEQIRFTLEEKQDGFQQRDQQLNEKERDLAGREALPFEQPEQAAPTADYGTFYHSLSPYGSWFQTANYGYVWQPAAACESNWRPYARGRWVCCDRGWNWVSEEPFGWATYHYGRWALLHGHGWIWVPGAEWAPCWVSWRENDNHIGWAPLPPETMAYHGHCWDSTVDVQFHIGASCFNFVEIHNFCRPIFGHCLPVSGNILIIAQTVNITYIHIQNRQIICGGPGYRKVSDRIGKPMPFYHLQVDQHPVATRNPLGMQPRIQDGRLVVSAPNINPVQDDALTPARIKKNLENVTVERDGELAEEITDRYRQSREDSRQIAEASIGQIGVHKNINPPRVIQSQEHRQLAENQPRVEAPREMVRNPDKQIAPSADATVPQPNTDRKEPARHNDREAITTTGGARVTPKPDPGQVQTTDNHQQEAMQRERQRQAEKDALIQSEKEQARQKALQEKQFQAEEARKQALEQQREQARLQLQEQEEAQRQREQARQQQQEMARQQQEAQRQQESARHQQEAQRQQESARQQQKEDNDKKRSRNQ